MYKFFISILALAILSAIQISCSSIAEDSDITIKTYPNAELLVDSRWLYENMDNEYLVIVDMRSSGFDVAHLDGAVNIAGAGALSDPDHPVESFLVGPERFAEMMSQKGISNEHQVVIYDDGNSLHAARLFYALEYYGHDNARILNGGFASWRDAGFPISTEPVDREETEFEISINEELTCDVSYIRERLDDPNTIIFDARSVDEFTGEDQRGKNAGHIPGAVNIEWSNFVYMDSEVPYFRTPAEISNLLQQVGITPEKEVIPHCHTNVRGSHAYFTLRLMGYDSVRPYEGSWSEYGNLDNVPVNR